MYRAVLSHSFDVSFGWDIETREVTEVIESVDFNSLHEDVSEFLHGSLLTWSVEYFMVKQQMRLVDIEVPIDNQGRTKEQQEVASRELRKQAYERLKKEFE